MSYDSSTDFSSLSFPSLFLCHWYKLINWFSGCFGGKKINNQIRRTKAENFRWRKRSRKLLAQAVVLFPMLSARFFTGNSIFALDEKNFSRHWPSGSAADEHFPLDKKQHRIYGRAHKYPLKISPRDKTKKNVINNLCQNYMLNSNKRGNENTNKTTFLGLGWELNEMEFIGDGKCFVSCFLEVV